MSEFGIFETDEFLERLEKLPPWDQVFVRERLASRVYPQLKQQPFFGDRIKKLRRYTPDTWRYRIRSFRLFYTLDINEELVHILTIEDRENAYR